MSIYSIYWIHYVDHIDPYSEGYIGITNDIERRYREHSRSKNSLLKEAINGNAMISILYDNIDYESACKIEYTYRPRKNVGWNIAAGGSVPPNQKGIKRSIETRQKMSAWQIGVKHTDERRLKNSIAHMGKSTGPQTQEHIIKRMVAKTETYPNHTEQARLKISNALKGKKRAPFSEETRRKMSKAMSKPKEKIQCTSCSRIIAKNQLTRHKCVIPVV